MNGRKIADLKKKRGKQCSVACSHSYEKHQVMFFLLVQEQFRAMIVTVMIFYIHTI